MGSRSRQKPEGGYKGLVFIFFMVFDKGISTCIIWKLQRSKLQRLLNTNEFIL